MKTKPADNKIVGMKVKTRYFAEIKIYDSKDKDIMIIPISSDFDLKGYKLEVLDAKSGLMRLYKTKKSEDK